MLSYRFNGHRSKPLACTTNPLLLLVLKVVMKDTLGHGGILRLLDKGRGSVEQTLLCC